MIIYKTTNLINGKIYIGQDSNNNPKYLGSGILLKKAVEKYGVNNFNKTVLEACANQEELNEREKYWIKECGSSERLIGYNVTKGGTGGDCITNNPNRAIIVENIRKSLIGRVRSQETTDKIASSHRGRKRSEESKLRMRLSQLGKKQSEAVINNRVRKNTGKTRSDETKKRMSDAQKGVIKNDRVIYYLQAPNGIRFYVIGMKALRSLVGCIPNLFARGKSKGYKFISKENL